MGDHHDSHRPLPVVAAEGKDAGRNCLSAASPWLSHVLRDFHGVTGFWISGLALFLLFSGLPWAKFWGDYLKNVRRLTGTAVARQDWTNGQPSTAEPKSAGPTGEHDDRHARSGRGWRRDRGVTPSDLTAVDRIVATLRPLDLLAPVVIEPPASGSGDWTAKSMTPNRPRRVDLVVDGRDRHDQGTQRFQGPSSHRQDRRHWHRRPRRATLRLARTSSWGWSLPWA